MSDERWRRATTRIGDSPEAETAARIQEIRATGHLTINSDGKGRRLIVAEMPCLPWAITTPEPDIEAGETAPTPRMRQWHLTHIPTTRRIPRHSFTVSEGRALSRALSMLATYGHKREGEDFEHGSPEHEAYLKLLPWIQSKRRRIRDLKALLSA